VNALQELRRLTPEEFADEHVLVAAAERDLQVAIQAALDIGSMILASERVSPPKRYSDIFPALADVGVLSPAFAEKLTGMARFRNVLVHLYLRVDAMQLYRYMHRDLEDFDEFARCVSEWLSTQSTEQG